MIIVYIMLEIFSRKKKRSNNSIYR